MLVFLSDLHFVDGTAGEFNLSHRAFEYFLEDITSIAKKPTNKIKEIKIVFLGDIFDLLRTEKWFNFPVNERPWGNNEPAIETNAQALFDLITGHPENNLTFQIIRQGVASLKEQCQLDSVPQVFYLTGNHDRLCNRYSSLRQKVCAILGISLAGHNPADPFPHIFQDLDHGVFARHGHEYDKFNYEGGISYTFQDYQRVPIGDPITTELVARVPYELAKRIEPVPWLTKEEKTYLINNFQQIENVRPLAATIQWLLYQVTQDRRIKELVEDAVQAVADDFDRLDFVQNWYARHDKWTDWVDEADQIQAFLFLLRKFKIYRTERLWELALRASAYFNRDTLREAAPQEYSHLDPQIRYVVYGHTHNPLVEGLRSLPGTPCPIYQVYLNTGTWRGRYFQAMVDKSFIAWKNMTYAIFYRPGERGNNFPVFETWTGALKTT